MAVLHTDLKSRKDQILAEIVTLHREFMQIIFEEAQLGFKPKPPRMAIAPKPLTEKQFVDTKISKDHGMSSSEVADEMGVPMEEINIAFSASDYDLYLKNRNRGVRTTAPASRVGAPRKLPTCSQCGEVGHRANWCPI